MLTTSEKFMVIMKRKGVTVDKLAQLSGETRQNLHRKFDMDDMKESDIRKYAKLMGYQAEVVFRDESTGDTL